MKYLALIAALALSACDSGTEWSDPPYEVVWIDVESNRSLFFSLGDGGLLGRVDPEIIAVGSNDKYVVAKQQSPGATTTLYYYIAKSNDGAKLNGHEITEGPFTVEEFEALSQKLGLPAFSRQFP
ncbi:hypothetical protein [Thiosocius teredinicola]|uniref:hypothetical protein n=1 Tax=Thiosocius teredinicola TaxID=1973002 RepID=UPI000990A146